MNYWKGLLFTGGYLSVAMVQAEAALEAQSESAKPKATAIAQRPGAADHAAGRINPQATALPLCPPGL